MPTRPYRILSRNLYQRLGARAAWDRAIEIIRKSELRRVDAQALMRTQRNARDEHLAEIKASLGGYRDLGDVELIPDLDTRIKSTTKGASVPRRDSKDKPARSSRVRK
jgi:hypothetical protein